MIKKTSIFLFTFLFNFYSIFSQSSIFNINNYSEYTLENGLEIFVMEDFSSATIQIEYAVKAGISSHNEENTGFFPLYSRLLKSYITENNSFQLKNLTADCNADSSRYKITIPPSKLYDFFSILSKSVFNPSFSDELINSEFSKFKDEIIQIEDSPATFINSSIDSRVFSEAPWKQDSGLYPALFAKTSADMARNILQSISENWYVPQNSAIFVTGCVKKEEVLDYTKKTFGMYKKATNPSSIIPVKAGGEKRKFVIVSPDFSKDITQIVVQYTSLSMNQCDIAAATFNNENSSLKRLLLRQKNLAIREPEYINIAAAHKNGSSRLIYQALLEKPVNKKVTLADQSELFLSKVKDSVKITNSEEYSLSKKSLIKGFGSVTANALSFMDYLSQYWAIENLNKFNSQEKNLLADRMCSRVTNINNENIDFFEKTFNSESPFIFVLLNTSIYENNKNSFIKSGYQKIDSKNSSWYTKKIKKNIETSDENEEILKTKKSDFIDINRASISSFKLENGIHVSIKNSSSTSNVLILISLEGGKFYSPRINGFEKIMINAFASNIQKEVNKYKINQIFESEPEILSETFNSYSAITVECSKEDASLCLKCISDALIFGEILPAEADSYVYSIQTQKRLFNANPINQLFYRGIRYLYDDSSYRTVFDCENDILQSVNYKDILAAYPNFLDASLYNVVIIGNIDYDYLKEPLKNTLGLLVNQNTKKNVKNELIPDFPDNKSVSVKIKHLFYTDIKAEDAGPMPAILVPTTNFSDPVQYWLKSPNTYPESIFFDAIVFRLQELLLENIDGICTDVKLTPKSKEVPGAAITFLTVDHTSKILDLYENSVKKLIDSLNSENSNAELQNIIDSWIMNIIQKTVTNRGTAILIRNGEENPIQYLDDYRIIQNSNENDYIKIINEYIPFIAPLRIYSTDAVK